MKWFFVCFRFYNPSEINTTQPVIHTNDSALTQPSTNQIHISPQQKKTTHILHHADAWCHLRIRRRHAGRSGQLTAGSGRGRRRRRCCGNGHGFAIVGAIGVVAKGHNVDETICRRSAVSHNRQEPARTLCHLRRYRGGGRDHRSANEQESWLRICEYLSLESNGLYKNSNCIVYIKPFYEEFFN